MSDTLNYWARRRVSRRGVIRGAGIAGAGLAGAALIGCGDDGPAATPAPGTPQPGTTPAAGATPTGTVDPFAHVKRGGTWSGDLTNDPPTIDPYGNLSFLTKGMSVYAYSRLYKVANRPDTNPWAVGVEPDAAESAESPDAQQWTVKLKPGIKFHNKAPLNGRELTSEDVVFSFERLSAPDSPGLSLVASAGWESVEAIDDHTVRFNLSRPTAAFLEDIADTNRLFIVPTEYDGGYDPKTDMIGSGPWILDSYRPGTEVVWSKNPDYFVEGQPFLDGARLAIVPEYANRLAQFEAGNTHATGIAADDVLDLRGRHRDVQWSGILPALLSFIFFAPEDQEPNMPWHDERFRFALSMAQHRDDTTELGYNVGALQQAGLDVSTAWNNLIPAGFAERWWLDPQGPDVGEGGKYFEYNPQEARALIEAGGWTDFQFPYRWSQTVYGSVFNKIAEAILGFITEVGLRPQAQGEDYASRYITNTFTGQFTGVAFGYETPFPEVGGYFPRMFGSDPANHSRWAGPEIDEILALSDKIAVELDEETRRGYVHEVQRINAAKMFYIPQQAGAGTGWTAYGPQVRGIRQTRGYGLGTENLIHFWLDT